jgi:hypothetical protein
VFGVATEIGIEPAVRHGVLKALTNRCKRMIVSDEPVVEVRAM